MMERHTPNDDSLGWIQISIPISRISRRHRSDSAESVLGTFYKDDIFLPESLSILSIQTPLFCSSSLISTCAASITINLDIE